MSSDLHIHSIVWTCFHTHAYTCIYMHTLAYTCIHLQTLVYTCIHLHAHAYTHIPECTHIYILTHYTHTRQCPVTCANQGKQKASLVCLGDHWHEAEWERSIVDAVVADGELRLKCRTYSHRALCLCGTEEGAWAPASPRSSQMKLALLVQKQDLAQQKDWCSLTTVRKDTGLRTQRFHLPSIWFWRKISCLLGVGLIYLIHKLFAEIQIILQYFLNKFKS